MEEYIKKSIKTKERILEDKELQAEIKRSADAIISAYKNEKKVLIAGNGGSASDAQHIAGELVAKFKYVRKGLSAFSLGVNSSVITAVANDYGYEHIFARQIQASGVKGDIFIAISTSGKSENIILALEKAHKNGLITIGLTGSEKSPADKFCNYLIKVPSQTTSIIQEAHIMIGHIICGIVEENLFKQ